MIKRLIILFTVGCLWPVKSVQGQVTETYFTDTEVRETGSVSDHVLDGADIILGGSSFDNYKYMPTISRYDTLGNMIWSTSQSDTTDYSVSPNHIYKMILSDDGNVYATTAGELWKVDATSGNILWRKSFYSENYSSQVIHICDFDAASFLVSYTDYYDGSFYRIKFKFVNKMTGDTISTHLIGNLAWANSGLGLGVDQGKNIYYTKYDTIIKVSSVNADSVIWKREFPIAGVTRFAEIYVDDNDSLFLFGASTGTFQQGKVLGVNKSNGNLLWNITAATADVTFSAKADKFDHLYVTWKQVYSGGAYSFFTTKVDKNTGTVEWNSTYSFNASDQYATSLVVDDSGKVYLTGFYGSANWAILKLDGDDGQPVYHLTITDDAVPGYDHHGIGQVAYMVNKGLYFVGQEDTAFFYYLHNWKLKFLKLDPSSGSVLMNRSIGGTYQFQSKAIAIEKFGAKKTVLFKQVGRYTEVAMLDSDKNLLWKRSFLQQYMLFAKNLSINENGNIIFTAYSVIDDDSPPYYSDQTDSIWTWFLDSSGNTLHSYNFYVGVVNAWPVEIQCDDPANTFIFYQKSGLMYFRKIASNLLSAEHALYIPFLSSPAQTQYSINASATSVLIFGFDYYKTDVIELNKNTLAIQYIDTLSLNIANYVLKKDDQTVYLGGKYCCGDEMVCYDIQNADTIWTHNYTFNAKILKFIFSEDSSFIYTMGSNDNSLVIMKVSASTGEKLWIYTYNSTPGYNTSPVDIAYDVSRHRLVATGYQTDISSLGIYKNVLILLLDTLGNSINTFVTVGDFAGDNIGICTNVLSDGSEWAGGNINDSIYGKAGFIFEVDSSYATFEQDNNAMITEAGFQYQIYPNPFDEFVTVNLQVPENNSSLLISLYTIEGIATTSNHFDKVTKGNHTYQINTKGLHGIYLMRLQVNDQVVTNKLIGGGE